MREPIKHSKLADLLLDFQNTTPKLLPAYINKVILETSGGVLPEGGLTPLPTPAPETSGFVFSTHSETELLGVDKRLVKCVRRALELSTQDFMVFDGLRTKAEQALHVKRGNSRTMESKHLDGLAVDLVPWIKGKAVWDWDACYRIAVAMDRAATEQGVANLITWGGAWDVKLSDFGGDAVAYMKEVQAYRLRHPGTDFIDGVHYEIQGPKQ